MHTPRKTWCGFRAIAVAFAMVAGMTTGLVATSVPASAATGNILPPFNIGETWSVCEGYNFGTHTGNSAYGLDLVKNSNGSCDNSTAGATAKAPLGGTVAYYQTDFGNLCINTTSGSYTLTHINATVTTGKVTAGQTVGTVAAAQPNPNVPPRNNGVAHIHFQMWTTANCYSSSGIPFDSAHGARICGAPDLTPSGGTSTGNGMWSGTSFIGASCGGSTAAKTTTSSSDVDGNGAADLVLTTNQPAGGSAASVLESTWENFLGTQQWWNDPTVGWAGIKPLVGDVNGDKKADYVFVANSGVGVRAYVALSTGGGFSVPQLWWNGDDYGYQGAKMLMGDVDGNGASDIIFVFSDGANGTNVDVALSTWQGFLAPQQWWSNPNYTFSKVNPLVGDVKITINPVTGQPDGAADLVLVTNQESAGTWAMVLVSSRSSFIAPALWWSEQSYAFADVKPALGDVDGNGAADLVLTHKLSNGGTEVKVALSTWEGFVAMTTWWQASDYGWAGLTPLIGDVKITIDPVTGQPDGAADLVLLTDEGVNGTKAWVAVSSRSSFVGSALWWHGTDWGYGGIKPSLG